MQAPPIPPNEARRLAALYSTRLLGTAPEAMFDRITRLATRLLKTPVSLVTLIDHDIQWFKSRQGFDLAQTSRDASFCGHVLLTDDTLVIPDTQDDPRFADNPLVTDKPFIRAYAGVPLHSIEGMRIGTLCVIDHVPRQFAPEELAALIDLARTAEELIQQRQYALASSRYLQLSHADEDDRKTVSRKSELEYLLTHDVVTGLPNGTLFQVQLTQAMSRWASAVVAAIDVGLPAACSIVQDRQSDDLVLEQLARRLGEALDDGALRSRVEGNRFMLAMADTPPGTARERLRRISQRLAAPVRTGALDIEPECRIGYAVFPDDGDNAELLIQGAYAALGHLADTAEPAIQPYRSEHWLPARKRLSLESQLRRAIEQEQFALHYQPKVDLKTGRVTGLEALIRWTHPEQGTVSPVQFIPLAEETGLIVPLGEWVLMEACRQMKRWQNEGLPAVPVAVNLSSRQFLDRTVVTTVERALQAADIGAGCLEVELTESASMSNPDVSARHMHQLREIGVSIAVDDFGTGYSSLSYLKKLPINKLKIDRSFVVDITQSDESLTIVQAVIAMAHRMGMTVVAEGVETAEQLAFLSINRCDEMQGYFFSRPLAADACAALLREGRRLAVHQPTQTIINALFGGN